MEARDLLKHTPKIPQCFVEKISADKAVDKLRSFSVIDFEGYKKVKELKDRARQSCLFYFKPKGNGNA